MWSKDIIFLISDGYADGAHAWVDSYHGFGQTSASSFVHSLICTDICADLNAQPLPISTGPIWAALHIDYPNHSFSHAGLFYRECSPAHHFAFLESSQSGPRSQKARTVTNRTWTT